MSDIISMQQFLVGKRFHIPTYQRDYSWNLAQVDDLLSDIQEASADPSGHYLGTIVLVRNGNESNEVVDGQQRLSTLLMLIHALLQRLPESDSDRIANEAILLRRKDSLTLDFGRNMTFVIDLLAGGEPFPDSLGQRRLKEAYEYMAERSKTLFSQGGTVLVKDWLETIKRVAVISFEAESTGRAIRIFQTVNDRGVPLTAMDKAKALLIYYSSRHLQGKLDDKINEAFGRCFHAVESMRARTLEPGYRIDNIVRDTFNEDDVLRYHYLAYHHDLASNVSDYDGTVRTVYESFLKGTLKGLSPKAHDLERFISDYIADLSAFTESFLELVSATRTDVRLYRLFVVLGLAARLYPLTIRLHQRGLLKTQVLASGLDMLHCIEVCDVRIYKTRGTEPAKDIGLLSHKSRNASFHELTDGIRDFVERFMPDGMFATYLSQDMYHNGALVQMLLWHEESVTGRTCSQSDVLQMVMDQITREHIIAQSPNWAVSSQGFSDETDFINHLHLLGNLTLLTKSENSKCSNEPTATKMTDTRLYARSKYAQTRDLAHQFSLNPAAFDKASILSRTRELVSLIMSHWTIQ